MQLKRLDYFRAGTRLVWIVDPEARGVDVYTSPSTSAHLTGADTLDGGDVLPRFSLPLEKLFGQLDRHGW
jgi:Uma2 family endonuclease